MRFALLFTFCVLASSQICHSQNTFGLHVGPMLQSRQGSAVCDSIAVTALTGMESAFIGVFYDRMLTDHLALRSELNYLGNGLGALVYNRSEDCLFCPIVKAGGVFYKTFEIPVTLNLKIPLNHQIGIGVLGGFGLDLNVPSGEDPNYSFKARHQGVSDVMYALHETPKISVAHYTYGMRLDVWRITVIGRYLHNVSTSVTDNIHVWGKEYGFNTSASRVHFSIGYNFYKLKFVKEDGADL